MIVIVLAQRQALPVVQGRLYGDEKKRQERCWQSVKTNAQSVFKTEQGVETPREVKPSFSGFARGVAG